VALKRAAGRLWFGHDLMVRQAGGATKFMSSGLPTSIPNRSGSLKGSWFEAIIRADKWPSPPV